MMTSQPPAPPTTRSAAPPPAKLLWLAVAASSVLVAAGGGAFYIASERSPDASPSGNIVITVRDGACSPNTITVPAGRETFKIVNQTNRTIEWEILDGVMVVEERENIVPGLSQTLSAQLSPGDYAMTCGLLANPRGVLHVTPLAGAAPVRPALVAYVGPLAEYRVFLATRSAALVTATEALAKAIEAQDLDQARTAYVEARGVYKQIEPAAKRFADLDSVINPTADYFDKREGDPAFVGFHRLEYGLFSSASTDGLQPIASRLLDDVKALKERVRAAKFTPDQMAGDAARLARTIADSRIGAGEDAYSKRDLADFDANLTGVDKIMTLLKPVAGKAAPDRFVDIESGVAAIRSELDTLRGGGGFPSYADVSPQARGSLAEKFKALADAIDKLNIEAGLG